MSDKKNIDRLFQEKFKDFEVVPSDTVWNRITESLPNQKKKRRVIALWWQIGGVAAVVALLLTVGVSVFNNSGTNSDLPIVNTDINDEQSNTADSINEINNTIKNSQSDTFKYVESEQDLNLEKEKKQTPSKNNTSSKILNPYTTQQKFNAVTNTTNEEESLKSSQKINKLQSKTNANIEVVDNLNTPKRNEESQLKSIIDNTIINKKTAVAENNSTNIESKNSEDTVDEKPLLEDPTKQSIEDAIAENTNPIIEKEEEKQTRWTIAPNVAPVYFNSMGKGSSLDKQFNGNSKSSEINMSYGIAGTFAVSNKLKIRAGVNRVNLSYTTSDVFAFTGPDTQARGIEAKFGNITFKDGVQSVSLMSSNMLNRTSAPEVFNTKIAGDIDQRFGYIEVPLEIEYRLLDTKIGINLIGGFSTLFLNENDVFADIDGVSTLIGKANNINDTSFSANFGLGLDYNVSKQWNINLEPTFKYQINAFNNTSGNFNPFFIGVYTGLSFKF